MSKNPESDPAVKSAMGRFNALRGILQERRRQKLEEGYSTAHDDGHDEGELALLAAAYALSSRRDSKGAYLVTGLPTITGELAVYGWEFKPQDRIRDLERAGALILAELERLLRKQEAV